jgi:dinuclear metal center YbgI/SA1388 family protein
LHSFFYFDMAAKNKARIQDIIGLINAFCPPALAEEWDNVGLQVGDPAAGVTRIAIALDPTDATIEEALAQQADLLICHHPLIFKALRQVTPGDETGKLVTRAISQNLAIFAAHTNLDRANGGLNDWLADQLGLHGTEPLEQPQGLLFKLAVFVPTEHLAKVADALFNAGAGDIGAYDRCSFRTEGAGTFRPGEATDPFIGSIGTEETVAETRLETVVPKEKLGRVVARMVKAHPYEEVAYDIYPLLNSRNDVGLGRLGRLSSPVALGDLARQVKETLGADYVRTVGPTDQKVAKVAVCGGSGASLLSSAARQGADVLVTGDVKYHDARIAESQGVCLIDAGHFATEVIMIEKMAQWLRAVIDKKGFEIEVLPLGCEQEPFSIS